MTSTPAGAAVHVLYSFPHAIGSPGIGVTALNQVRGLVAAGARVTLYCASVAAPLPSAVEVVTTLTLRGRRIPHRALGVDRSYRYHDARAALALQRGSFDVVHAWPLGALRTEKVAARRGIPAFREVPNTHTADAYEQGQREMAACGLEPPQGYSHRPNARRLAHEEREYANALLLVPSANVARTFTDRGYPETTLRHHQYGYDPTRFTAESTTNPTREAALRAVFVGSCEPRKGLHYALQAWRDSAAGETGTLLIAGRFVPGYRDFLGPLLTQRGVQTLDFSDDVPALMRGADLLLLPSVEEGSALVTYEALGSGCTLLVSDAAGSHVEHDVSGLIHPARDVATLTDQLRRLVTAPEELARLRAGARELAPSLTWDVAGLRLLEIYRAELT